MTVPLADEMSWRMRGECKNYDATLWFPEETGSGAQRLAQRAAAICRACDVQEQCLEWALARGERYGVWGGYTAAEREYILRRRQE